MTNRSVHLTVLVCCLALTGVAQAQTPPAQHVRSDVSGLVRALDATPLTASAFRLEPWDAILVSRPFQQWVREWRSATEAALLPESKLLSQVRLARYGGAPGGLAQPGLAAGDVAGRLRESARAEEAARLAAGDSLLFLPPTQRQARGEALAGVSELSDLGIRVVGSGDFGGSWTRYKPCDPGMYINCSPSLFPQLKPETQFGVQVGGTVSDRVHLDVDYDQTREFDAANNINVFYQGLPHEVLQRLEVGDVSIRLPSSRYMTRGIPAGNFGFMASAQFGPLDVQTVFAQQKGDVTTREFRVGSGAQAGIEQDAAIVLDDADYARGQFFFLVEPRLLRNYPHVDAMQLRPTDAAASARPAAGGSIELYRDERFGSSLSSSAQLGYFLAEALPPGGGARHTGTFRRLVQDVDYVVHSSGMWVMLRSPLRPDEALAVAYLTESGDTIGTLRAENAPAGTPPRLRLLRGPVATHFPGVGTWEMEMHQVYRLDSAGEVDVSSIDLRVSLGELSGGRTFRNVLGQQLSFLRFFGLDEESPADRIDASRVFQPARDVFSGGIGTPIAGTFLIFPTLRPFAQPGPLQSARLSAADLQAALGRDANAAIYSEPDPVTRAASGRFRLNFNYRVRVEGLVTSFSLGAFGIREGSERLYLGSRLLERNVDYTIEYDVGVVMLLDARTLLGTMPGAEIRATWEQKSLFAIAPTSVFGASARYELGRRGELNFLGLYQAEKSLMTRPQLGVEPASTFLGGVSGRFDLGAALLDRLVDAVPGTRRGGGAGAAGPAGGVPDGLTLVESPALNVPGRPSSAVLSAELALSMPNPNRRGAAYLDDFESSDVLTLSPRRQEWRLGSAPQSHDADRGTLPHALNVGTAAPLVWQHDILQDGRITGAITPRNIDRQINIAGTEMAEPVMWLTFGRPAAEPGPVSDGGDPRRWRSMTTVLSPTGHDLTRAEYLEFYVSARHDERMALIFDLGTVSEDAFHFDAQGRTSGSYPDGTRWGLGVLDEEASLVRREVWGTEADRRGLWNQECQAEPLVAYPLGDPRSNCTRGNGVNDSEDLNGNGILDPDDGPLFRYVVQLDRLSEYLVRDTAATGTGYRLYRIPLRSGTPVNGASDATWRFIRHLRITVAGEPAGVRTMTLARMRVVGSRWTKRDGHGIQHGLLAAEPGVGAASTELRVGPVSRVTDGAAYAPPPGVVDQLQDPSAAFGIGYHEINTRSLRIGYSNLEPNDRAEVYFRYPQQPRNLLTYREMRLWVVAREGNWGAGGDERFTVRVGTDPRNYYLFQTPLRPATGPRAATAADWMPEIVIDFQQWWNLKAQAERLLIERGPRTTGADTLWSADSTYALVLEDRARAPNLAAVRELVFAVWNGGSFATTGEVWIDELRVSAPDRDPGGAGNIALDLVGGDLMSASISLANQGALFRQLGQTPHYMGGADLAFSADARLDRMLPESWGLDLPLSVSHARNVQAPVFLQQSDVAADRLDGLRDSGSDVTRVGLRIARREPMANPLLGLLVDGTELRVGYSAGTQRTVMSSAHSSGITGDISHRRDPVRRDLPALPAPLAGALRSLAPARLEESDPFRRLVGSRLRWSPSVLSFGSMYSDQLTRSFLFERILELPGDTMPPAIESPRQALRNDLRIALQPFDRLNAQFSLASERDVLAAHRASTRPLEQDALQAARTSLAGMDVGWETSRLMNTSVNYRPEITRWLRVGYLYDNRYITDRNPAFLQVSATGSDSTARLQRRFESTRQETRTITLQPSGLAVALGADSASVIGNALRRWETVDASWRATMASQFDRRGITPGFGYQFGIGGFDAFRVMGADTAARAQQRDNFNITAGFLPMAGARLEIGYQESDTESFDARGGTRLVREVSWPRASLMLRELPVPRLLQGAVRTASGSVGVQRIERSQLLGFSGSRGTTELNFPFSVSLGMAHGFALSYRGSWSAGETLDPTGNAENAGFQQDVTLSGVIQPPQRWKQKLDGPIIVSLNYADQQQRQCRFQPTLAAYDGCIAFIDLGTRNANARLETRISDLDVGLLFNYVGRQNRVGLQNGSDQFQFGIYGRFNFEAGEMPFR
jgi:hypothetical protein